MTVALPAYADLIIVSVEYAANGLDWARLYDNHALGWLIDETTPIPADMADTRAPPHTTGAHAPFPIILGSLPVPAPPTAPIQSPQWCKFVNSAMLIADGGRFSSLSDFLTWLATNNGAQRLLQSQFIIESALIDGFTDWAYTHTDLVYRP
jgi:hypothetical protein